MVQSNEPVAVDKARWWQPYRMQIARSIYVASALLSLCVAWQIVLFWMGRIGAPLVDQLAQAAHWPMQPESATTAPAVWLAYWYRGMYLLLGAAVWAMLAHFVYAIGCTFGALVEVGVTQYRREVKEAQRWRARDRAIERRREMRDEARRRAAEEIAPKSRFSFTTLLIGIVIGELI
jgi:hypothetical protein